MTVAKKTTAAPKKARAAKAPTDHKPARKRADTKLAAPAPAAAAASAPKPPKTIVFLGREIAVVPPTFEQLTAWNEVLEELQAAADPDGLTADQAMAMVSEAQEILQSVIVNDDDKRWLRRQRVAGKVDLEKSGQIILDTCAAYGDEIQAPPTNRAARRTR